MNTLLLLFILLVISSLAYGLGVRRALRTAGPTPRNLHSLPGYHGLYVAIWCAVPALLVLLVWLALEPFIIKHMLLANLPDSLLHTPDGKPLDSSHVHLLLQEISNTARNLDRFAPATPEIGAAATCLTHLTDNGFVMMGASVIVLGCLGAAYAIRRITPALRTRNTVERALRVFMILCSFIAVVTTIGIVLSLVFESVRFFAKVPITDFLFGLSWSPQLATRPDQVGSSGAFGAIPLFAGTLLIAAIALLVAVPIGLMSAIYMSEYANPRFRAYAKPALEILAGIPTVVYGFFAALTVAPFFKDMGGFLGLDVSSESAIAAGVVMGIMIVPFVSSLSDDVISAVPQSLREGSLGLGATKSETIRKVIFPAALPGIVGSILLAASRAIGETMIVVMAAGFAANLTANPFEAVTTVTVQIAALLVGDQEFDSPKTLAAFALGLVLFCITLALNVISLYVVRKYREQYE